MDLPSRRSVQSSRRNSTTHPPSAGSTHSPRPRTITPASAATEAAAVEAAAAMLGIQRPLGAPNMHTGFDPHYSGIGFGRRDNSIRGSAADSGLTRMQDTYGLDLGRIEEQDEEHDGPDHGHDEADGVLEMDDRELMGYDTTEPGMQVKTEEGGTEQSSGWTHESKTKAGKERKRLPLACIMCRRKKIRCSGEKPACKHCVRSRIPCVYKQTARKTAPRTDYMNMLDRRMKRMEDRLLKNIPKEEVGSVLANTGRSVVKPSSTASGKKRSASSAFEDSEDLWASTNRTPKKAVLDGKPGGIAPIGSGEVVDIDNGAEALPREDIQEHLAETFFDYTYGQPFLLLHKPTFMRQLRSRTIPPILVLAVCAVAARFSQHPVVQHDHRFLAGEKFAIEARRQIFKNFDSPSVTHVTVCILLAMYEFGAGYGARAWTFSGMAIRMAHGLQLHREDGEALQEPDGFGYSDPRTTIFLDKEMKRRCMWACYLIDQSFAAGTDRPCLIHETELEIRLPANEPLERESSAETLHESSSKGSGGNVGQVYMSGGTQHMGLGAYVVKIVAVYGRVVRWVNQNHRQSTIDSTVSFENSEYRKLQNELAQFADELPERYHQTPENNEHHVAERQFGQYLSIHITWQAARMFLQNPILATASDGSAAYNRAYDISLGAATRIAEMINDAREREQTITAPFVGFCASNASTFLLLGMLKNTGQQLAHLKQNVESCMRLLTQLQQYWVIFNLVMENIKSLYKQAVDLERVVDSASLSQRLIREHMLQYGDWMMKHQSGIYFGSQTSPSLAKVGLRDGIHSPVSTTDMAPSGNITHQNPDELFSQMTPQDGPSRSSKSATALTPGSGASSITPQPHVQHLHPGYRYDSASSTEKNMASPALSRHHSGSNVSGLSPAASRTPASSHPHSHQHASPAVHQGPMNVSTPTTVASASASTGALLQGTGDTLNEALSGNDAIESAIVHAAAAASYVMDPYSLPMEPRNEAAIQSHASAMRHHHQQQQRRALQQQQQLQQQYETFTPVTGVGGIPDSGFLHDSRGQDHHSSAAYLFDTFGGTGHADQQLMEAMNTGFWTALDTTDSSSAAITTAFGPHAEDGSRAGSVTSRVSGGAVGGGVVTGAPGVGGAPGTHLAASAVSSGWYIPGYEPGASQPEFQTARPESSDAAMRRRSSAAGHNVRGRPKGAGEFQHR